MRKYLFNNLFDNVLAFNTDIKIDWEHANADQHQYQCHELLETECNITSTVTPNISMWFYKEITMTMIMRRLWLYCTIFLGIVSFPCFFFSFAPLSQRFDILNKQGMIHWGRSKGKCIYNYNINLNSELSPLTSLFIRQAIKKNTVLERYERTAIDGCQQTTSACRNDIYDCKLKENVNYWKVYCFSS